MRIENFINISKISAIPFASSPIEVSAELIEVHRSLIWIIVFDEDLLSKTLDSIYLVRLVTSLILLAYEWRLNTPISSSIFIFNIFACRSIISLGFHAIAFGCASKDPFIFLPEYLDE